MSCVWERQWRQEGYRKKAFLMTKTDGRTKETATAQIEESLRRLQTDHFDLLQHHEVLRFDDPDRIFAAGAPWRQWLRQEKAGKIRYIGFTGHKAPHVHLYMHYLSETFSPGIVR